MTSAMLRAYNRAQTNIILGSTSLKIKVGLKVNGVDMECADFDTIPQMRKWVTAKVEQYRLLSPGAKLDFIAL
jgi:hypothetical protein